MAKEIRLPEVSKSVESGDVVKVLVKKGDTIEIDQPVIELETDKAMFEVPSTEAGTVTEINVKEGDIINIGDLILKLDSNGAAAEDGKPEKTEKESPKESKKESKEEPREEIKEEAKEEIKEEIKEEKPEEQEKQEERDNREEKAPEVQQIQEAQEETPDITSDGIPAPASPSVRRLARELGADINSVPGSGPGGRISQDDVKMYVKSAMSRGAAPASPGGTGISHRALPDFSKWGDIVKEPMSKVRKLTADSMTYAWTTIPQVTQFDKADITELEAFRKKQAPKIEKAGGQLTVTAILLKVISIALEKFPQFNASIDMAGQEVIYKKYFNIGIAVDTDRGLLVPVVKGVNGKSLKDLAIELSEIAEKTREKKITPEEMDGGNFTISNLGGIGGTNFTPIVYSPQVAILGVSRASMEPVYKDGEFVPGFVMPLTLTYDHRIIDGADAARFLRWVCEALENPFSMLL